MKSAALDEIRRAVHGRYRAAPSAVRTAESVTIDTRTAKPGDLFIAIRGATHDGHEFLASAAQAGCVAAVVSAEALLGEPPPTFPGGIIGVADTTVALGELGACGARPAVRRGGRPSPAPTARPPSSG